MAEQRMLASPFHGLLVVDKPGGLTSRAVVDRAQRWFPRGTRIGHTGTLDPLATGVLVLGLGQATRFTEYVQRMRKTYRSTFLLGARSDTDDADGTVASTTGVTPPEQRTIADCLRTFLGEIEQVPPAFSAAKVTGQRAYNLARRGKEVSLQPRRVTIYGLDVLAYAYPRLEVEVSCGKGTYIRSLARDLGERLGCGGLVQTLRRTQVGPFVAEEGVKLEVDAAMARARLLPVATAVADLPRVDLVRASVERLAQGQSIPFGQEVPAFAKEVAVFAEDGVFVAVAAVDRDKHLLRPEKVLPGIRG